jgi:hypothetical protein
MRACEHVASPSPRRQRGFWMSQVPGGFGTRLPGFMVVQQQEAVVGGEDGMLEAEIGDLREPLDDLAEELRA